MEKLVEIFFEIVIATLICFSLFSGQHTVKAEQPAKAPAAVVTFTAE